MRGTDEFFEALAEPVEIYGDLLGGTFMYNNWATDMEVSPWYAVIPGTKGPIATPRWQALHQVIRDIDRLTTAEYLVDRHGGTEQKLLAQHLDEAKMAGQEGNFYTMRTLLDEIINNDRQK